MDKLAAAYELGRSMALKKVAYTPMSLEEYRRLEQERDDRGASRRTLASIGTGLGAGALYAGLKGQTLESAGRAMMPRIDRLAASGKLLHPPGFVGTLKSVGQGALLSKDALSAGIRSNYGAARTAMGNAKGFMPTLKALGRSNLGRAGLLTAGTALGTKMLLGGASGLLD